MKRRKVLLNSAALAVPAIIGGRASAQSASLLGSTLTPLGANPKPSASGLVPAWTGAVAPPSGWKMGDTPPNFFPGEQPIFTVTADNMDKYADMLCEGQKQMLQRYAEPGWSMIVYPSKRNFAAPQYVYDNTVKNMTRARPSAGGLTLGFQGAYGGVPFPIPSEDPVLAGLQIMNNHQVRFQGQYQTFSSTQIVCSQGANVLALGESVYVEFPYYFELGDPDAYNGLYASFDINYTMPSNQAGGKVVTQYSSDVARRKNAAFEYLVGEGRIREAPAAEYDVPETEANDAVNYDETYVFGGAMDRYTWKLVGVKEMIIAYNVHGVFHAQPDSTSMMKNFINPELVRWEVHRCYKIEARLAPGKRHTKPYRIFYVDEDTWAAVMSDGWDAQGNYWRFNHTLPSFSLAPEGPVAFWTAQHIYNLQSNQYVVTNPWFAAPFPMGSTQLLYTPVPNATFNPDSMAASGGL